MPYRNSTASEPSRSTAPTDHASPVSGRLPACHRAADLAHLQRDLAAVPAHPDAVPRQHQRRDEHHARVEDFLPHAGRPLRDRVGERRDQARADHAADEPAADPPAAARHALRGGHHDRHDERGLEHFTEHDQGS
jgi:hypothetical protein